MFAKNDLNSTWTVRIWKSRSRNWKCSWWESIAIRPNVIFSIATNFIFVSAFLHIFWVFSLILDHICINAGEFINKMHSLHSSQHVEHNLNDGKKQDAEVRVESSHIKTIAKSALLVAAHGKVGYFHFLQHINCKNNGVLGSHYLYWRCYSTHRNH